MASHGANSPGTPNQIAVSAAVAAIAAGRMVVVTDDPHREDEGDLVMAARHAKPESIGFMAMFGRGLICAPMLGERLDELGLPAMIQHSDDPRGTAFHVGVDLRGQRSGISATERSQTIRRLADPRSAAADFTRPGHVFPLAYRPGGVLRRAGHTEASVDLVELAGQGSSAVICEILADDGDMLRGHELAAFAKRHQLPIVRIAQLASQLRKAKCGVQRISEARVPLEQGEFRVIAYRDVVDNREHLAAVHGDVAGRDDVLLRVHSECLTGDVLGSQRCDCGRQLDAALSEIVTAGAGVVVYLRGHEGRGIGLSEKLRAYELQDGGLDTVDANLALGHPVDARDYGVAGQIIADLEITGVRLLTNNPAKRASLVRHGIVVRDCVPLATVPTAENVRYLETKRDRMNHTLLMRPQKVARHAPSLGRLADAATSSTSSAVHFDA